jgi:L-aminopeptidase/D-esterase-like protein
VYDGVVATNAHYTKVDLKKIAPLAHQGSMHSIVLVHGMVDGIAYG